LNKEQVMFHKILVGLDGSPGSMRAMEVAAALARELGATLHALSVIEPAARYAGTVGEVNEESEAAEAYMRQVHEHARQIAAEHGVSVETMIVHGHAAQTLVVQSRTGGYDLVVVGHSGHSGVWGSFLGTTTDKVSRHAACSVLIVR
jgi:nucleotide-binding universal stress UspA family protein